MAWYDKINETEITGRGDYLPWADADYDATVIRCMEHSSKKGAGDFFIVEFTIDRSYNPDVPDGAKRSWQVPISGGQGTKALENIKAFMLGVFGLPTDDKTLDVKGWVPHVVGPPNAFGGKKVRIHTVAIVTQGRGKSPGGSEFTVHEFPANLHGAAGMTMIPGAVKHANNPEWRNRPGAQGAYAPPAAPQYPAAQPQWGQQPLAFGAPPAPPASPGFAPPPPGFGAPPAAPQASPGFGAPPPPPAYPQGGQAPPAPPGFGAPPPPNGAPPAAPPGYPQWGQPPQAPPAPAGFTPQPPPGGFAPPPAGPPPQWPSSPNGAPPAPVAPTPQAPIKIGERWYDPNSQQWLS